MTGLAFLLAFSSGCVLALARHPLYGLLTYVAVFYLHPPSAWWGATLPDLRWSLLAAVITLAAVWLHSAKLPRLSAFWMHRVPWLFLILSVWLAIQLWWAVLPDRQMQLLVLYVKYIVLLYVIFRILVTEKAIRAFLWAHIVGCFYMGWTAFTSHSGGRFEGFRGPDISEANAGALTLATGFFFLGALFLASKWRARLGLAGIAPFLLDGIVRTASRGGFLALSLGGTIFTMLAPKQHRKLILALGVIAIGVFLALTNALFWQRIGTIHYLGEHVEGLDTGSGRVSIMVGQLEMFKSNPLGHGHRATPYLSPYYIEESVLSAKPGETRAEIASHNTFMSLLVEQGVLGAAFYLALAVWTLTRLARLRRRLRGSGHFGEVLVAGLGAAMAAILSGDMFVDYLKLEIRVWFTALLMVAEELWPRAEADSRAREEASA